MGLDRRERFYEAAYSTTSAASGAALHRMWPIRLLRGENDAVRGLLEYFLAPVREAQGKGKQ